MEHYAGTLELSSVCIVDAQGKIVRETKVASEPEALVAVEGRWQCLLFRALRTQLATADLGMYCAPLRKGERSCC